MSGLDKILGHISEESESAVKGLLEEAEKKAQAVLLESEKKTSEECDRIKKKAESETLNVKERAAASAELKTKRILLSAKQEIIEDTIAMIKSKLSGLSDSDYTEYFGKLFDKHIPNADAVMKLSEKDLKRIPKELLEGCVKKAEAKGSKLTVSDKPAAIENGFVLDFGGVEENCSFTALIEQNAEEIKDIINKILFA